MLPTEYEKQIQSIGRGANLAEIMGRNIPHSCYYHMMNETCKFHPDRQAYKWRDAICISELPRVPLCFTCCSEITKGGLPFSLHPLDEVHVDGRK